jgi:hypothetical protein
MDGLLLEERERKRKRERRREREKDEGKSKRKRPLPKSMHANKAGALLSSNERDEPTFKQPKETGFFSLSLYLFHPKCLEYIIPIKDSVNCL